MVMEMPKRYMRSSAKRELLTAAGLEDCPKCTSKVPAESSAFSEVWKRKLKEIALI